jgi:hypothetical protein
MDQDALIPTRRLDMGMSLGGNKPTEYFLRGPIPLWWLERAAALPGKVCALGQIIWWFHGMNPDQPIKVTRKALERFSISEDAYRDGLKRLELAGLIRVTRPKGQRALIQIEKVKGPELGRSPSAS